MFKKTTIDYRSSGVLNPLVLDYLTKNETLRSFYGNFPDKQGFASLLKTSLYSGFDRDLLVETLVSQSALVKNTSEQSVANIGRLGQKNVFTVTTGHQLCLFTGPLYFIYKIFSTINLAEKLREEFSDYDFIPVYWMASEDHDFEEVNNFHIGDKKIVWKSEQGGAVGDFNPAELKKIVPELTAALGRSEHSDRLIQLFETSYLNHPTLATATRFLVNELFGEYGLVIVDGDDKQFKSQFKEQFRKDIFDHSPASAVNHSIKQLQDLGYHIQVNPRTINCFYLEKGARSRIEKNGDAFRLVGSGQEFSKAEMEEIIEKYPERISPNVVLRPLYQQSILPNLAYVGGPGELAYWLEFKKMFDDHKVFFPVLVPRNFVTVIDKTTKQKIEKFKFEVHDFFKSEQDLIKELQVKTNSFFELTREKDNITTLYEAMLKNIRQIDETLSGSVSAELARASKGLERLEAKANRALRRKSETEINRLTGIKQRLFPNNVPQERFENFASFYLAYGDHFFKAVKANANPLSLEYIIMSEE